MPVKKPIFSTVAHTQASADEAPPTADAATSGRQDPKASRDPGKTSQASDVQTSAARIAFTWRLTPAEADQLDTLILQLRRQLGRGRLDKASVLLALVQLADERSDVHAALLDRLKG